VVTARDLRGWRPTGVLGLAYRRDGIHLGVSYRPPIRWRTTGVAEVDFPEALDAVGARLTDDAIRFETWQAGSLRFGVGFTEGQHPGRPERPLYELAADVVWEDHSRTESFDVEMEGAIANDIEDEPVELAPIRQIKNWRDTLSLRVGGSWGALPWLTAHAGFYLETPAQPRAYTNVDFVSWERRMLGFGSTFHLGDWIDLKLGYGHVFMPDRRVTDGEVYNQIPLSGCTGPDYQSDACEVRGQPPGNPQNEGSWSASFQIISAGLTLRFD
jgi:long-subunit fatty acid transport protein